MMDIHSHVLPCMDDGSAGVEESIEMLIESARQGIQIMAATPHFYPTENSIEEFLIRREASAEKLRAVWREEYPSLLLGAEVYYFRGISRVENIEKLRIEETELLLLEMPFEKWNDRMLSEVLELQARPGIQVLLAHIERYLRYQKNPGIWEPLLGAGVRVQCNAEFFQDWRTRGKAARMMKQGKIFLLGSDSHNMTSRPPRMGEALEMIGEQGRKVLEENAREVMLSRPLDERAFDREMKHIY